MAQPHGSSLQAIDQLRRKSSDLALRSDDPLDRSISAAVEAISAVFEPAYDGHADRAMQKLSWERGIAAHSEMAGGVTTRSISFGLVESLYFVLDRVVAMGQERTEQERARHHEIPAQHRPSVDLPPSGQRTSSIRDYNQISTPHRPSIDLPPSGQRSSSIRDYNKISAQHRPSVDLPPSGQRTSSMRDYNPISAQHRPSVDLPPSGQRTSSMRDYTQISAQHRPSVDLPPSGQRTMPVVRVDNQISVIEISDDEEIQNPRRKDRNGHDEISPRVGNDSGFVEVSDDEEIQNPRKADSIGHDEMPPLDGLIDEAKLLWVLPSSRDDVVEPPEPSETQVTKPLPSAPSSDAAEEEPKSTETQVPSRSLAAALEAQRKTTEAAAAAALERVLRVPEANAAEVKQEEEEAEDFKMPVAGLEEALFDVGWGEMPPILQGPGAYDADMLDEWGFKLEELMEGEEDQDPFKGVDLPTATNNAVQPRNCKRVVAAMDGPQESANGGDSWEADPTVEPAKKKKKKRSKAKNGLEPDGTGQEADVDGGAMGAKKREPQVKKNSTDLACPECDLVTRSLSTFLLHIKRVHGTSPTVFSHILRCDCGNECCSVSHARTCPIAHFTLMRREDSKYANVEDDREYPQCVLCEAHPTTILGYIAHLLIHHSTTLSENGIYLACACGVRVHSRYSNARWSHTDKCAGLFTVQELTGEEDQEDEEAAPHTV